MDLTVGTKIYFGGDMCNESGFGTITDVHCSKWGRQIQITMDDGRTFHIPPAGFSEIYLGHGGTRFVTKQAYEQWRERHILRLQREMMSIAR